MGLAMDFSGDESFLRSDTGERRRHHLHESVLQTSFKEAASKPVFSSLRETIRCVTHLLPTC
jgi:hypothetical protein